MLDRAVTRTAPLFEELHSFIQCAAAYTQADSWCTDNLLFGWLLPVLSGKINPQNGVAHAQEELCVGPGDAPLLLHDRVTLIPPSRARRHMLLAFAPELRADIISSAPADPVLHGQAEELHIKIFRPFEIVTFHRGVIDAKNFTVFSGLRVAGYQLNTIAVEV